MMLIIEALLEVFQKLIFTLHFENRCFVQAH